ncbi:MAG TPA: acetyl CoA synthetase [Candidatus Methanomethylia archaeon]|nr:acetyl CoA synthetase [Candidatus Methanomethylicia archaeon]
MNHPLTPLFQPKAVAIIGASHVPGKVGYAILENLVKGGYAGRIYPINPHAREILGLKVYPSILDVKDEVDLAVIAIPAGYVPDVLEQCGEKGVKVAAVISSGFSEVGNVELEEQLLEVARRYGIRILGPNMFGVVYSPSRLNANFGIGEVHPGKIAFITQSGALGAALAYWATAEKIGFSAIISVGNKADIDDAELLDYLAEDPNTRVVLIYMESVKDGRKFMKSAKECALKKPVIVMKAGRSAKGAEAVASHTGSLAGSDAIYDAAFKQCGVLRAITFIEAFDWAKVMAMQPPPRGKNTVIITNGGGLGVLATDACEDLGIPLPPVQEDLRRALKAILPPFASLKNPIDLTGQADEDLYYHSVKAVLEHPSVDNVITLQCETALAPILEVSKAILDAHKDANVEKPHLICVIGGLRAREAAHFLEEHSLPVYNAPERPVSALHAYMQWSRFTGLLSD